MVSDQWSAAGGQESRIRRPARLVAVALLAVSLAGCRPHDFPQYPQNYREYVYVTNGGSDTVTVLDVVNVRVDRELAVGRDPVAVAASPTRNEIYVVNSGAANAAGSLSVIDAEHNTVVATIPLRQHPVAIDVDAKGNLAYVANSGSNSVSVVDLKQRREIAEISTGEEPVAARLSPDGKTLVVANRRGDSVTLIDPASGHVRAVFADCPGANGAVILSDSSKAFVPCAGGHQVMVVALAQAGARPALPDRLETLMDVGRAPVELTLKPDGGEQYVMFCSVASFSSVLLAAIGLQRQVDRRAAHVHQRFQSIGLAGCASALRQCDHHHLVTRRARQERLRRIGKNHRAGCAGAAVRKPRARCPLAGSISVTEFPRRLATTSVLPSGAMRAATGSSPAPICAIFAAGPSDRPPKPNWNRSSPHRRSFPPRQGRWNRLPAHRNSGHHSVVFGIDH